MANATDPSARHIHGADPQSLIDKIIRLHIYDSPYWKEHCFGLNAATLIDQAVLLSHIGGTHSAHSLPSPFLCLTLKLLQIQPPLEVIEEFILQPDHKYLRVLGAFYYRLVGRGVDVWRRLEALLVDYRKLRRRKEDGGWEIVHVDEVVDEMLHGVRVMNVTMPRLMRRELLVQMGKLEERVSPLEEMLKKEEEEEREKQTGGEGKLLMPGEQEMKESEESEQRKQIEEVAPVTVQVKEDERRVEEPRPPSERDRGSEGRRLDRGREDDRRRDRSKDRDEERYRRDHHHRSRRRLSLSSSSRSPSRDRHRRRDNDDDDRYHRRHDRHDDRSYRRRHSRSRSRSRSPRRHKRSRSR